MRAVPSQQCQNSDTGGADCLHTVLGTKSSSSFVPQADSPFQVTYGPSSRLIDLLNGPDPCDSAGTGNVEGILATDDVNIAGLKLSNHTFGVTTSESNDFASKDVFVTPFYPPDHRHTDSLRMMTVLSTA